MATLKIIVMGVGGVGKILLMFYKNQIIITFLGKSAITNRFVVGRWIEKVNHI